MINIMINIRYISRCVIQISKSVRFILHALSSDYRFSSVHVNNLPPLRSKKTRGPDVAASVSRLICMRCHDNLQSDTPQSNTECRTDITIRTRTVYIYTKCHICIPMTDELLHNASQQHPPGIVSGGSPLWHIIHVCTQSIWRKSISYRNT